MRTLVGALALVLACAALAEEPRRFRSDTSIACDACDEWNAPQPPFRVFGNTYFVGTAGLGAVLVTSPKGHVLLDGGLPQSAERIDASIRALGFRTEDVRLIVNSHAHYDHAGGIAALQRASGAQVAASASGARALESGGPTPDDPQYAAANASADAGRYPRVKGVRVVADGEIVRLGELAITAHLTPGHTPGATTWSWRSCEGERCLSLVYADSLNAVSLPGFRFTGDATRPSLVPSFERSIDVVAALPCDILLAVHPGFSRMHDALKARGASPDAPPVIDKGACPAYAAGARQRLTTRVAEESGVAPPPAR
ncbi:MAG: subclass B3 metallo-beta-lactamase [Burkholderiales bacterium]